MANEFLDVLSSAPAVREDPAALAVLDEFCDGIRAFTGERVLCWREPGFITNLGQEWRVLLKPAVRDYQQVLLRAHVPVDAFPVHLDLYEEAMVVCADAASLREQLKRFLQQSSVRETLTYLSR
jgi:hypothetical protein